MEINLYRCDYTDKGFNDMLKIFKDLGQIGSTARLDNITQLSYNNNNILLWRTNCGLDDCMNEALCMKKVRMCDIKKIKGEL